MATHGVIVNEIPTTLLAPIQSDSAIQVAVGTAPVNLAASPGVNVPVLTNSYAEAVTKLGWSEDFESYTLCQVMSASFQVFNVKPVVFINVLDPAIHREVVAEAEYPVTSRQVLIAAEQNETRKGVPGILLDTIVVKSKDSAATYEPGTDYVAAFNDDGFTVVSIVESGNIPTSITHLSIGYSKIDPFAVTESDILGGYNAATGKYKGIECISQVYPRLGILPGILTAPGWSHNPAVAMALLGKTENLNGSFKCVTYVDIDSSAAGAPTYDKVKAWKDENSYTDKQMYPLWPKAVIGGRTYYLSALAAALTAQTDVANAGVPALSPSNKGLRITGIVNETGDEVCLDQTQANFVNSGGVATAVNIGGWKLWGNYTAAYPENTDPKDFWLNMRRLFAWDANGTVQSLTGSVDDPISQRLIQTVVNTKNLQGNGYVAAGHLGAYRCEYVPDENPLTDIIAGTVRFHLYLSPYPPAQTIVFTQEFDPYALEASLNGGGA